jgi:hypothetical protein
VTKARMLARVGSENATAVVAERTTSNERTKLAINHNQFTFHYPPSPKQKEHALNLLLSMTRNPLQKRVLPREELDDFHPS